MPPAAKREWTAEEYTRWQDSGEFPAWHPKYRKQEAPDHNSNRNLSLSSLRQKYEEFIARYPWIIDAVIQLALRAQERGYEGYGMRLILEKIRWEYEIEGRYDSVVEPDGTLRRLKINNNHLPFLSRHVMNACPALDGFFETREQTHEG